MNNYYNGLCSDEIYEKIFYDLASDSNSIVESRSGKTKEELHVVFNISNPIQRWITCRKPVISPAFAFAELIFLMNGCNEAEIINKWNPLLPNFQGKYEKYPGSYGHRLQKEFGVDQFDLSYETLKYNPNSRQVVLNIWDPNIDLPKKKGLSNNEDIPCNICSLLKLRDEKLYWIQIMRSNDLFLGLPYDILLFTHLQEIFAGWLNADVGDYMQVVDSMHYYIDKKIEIQDKILITNTDDLKLDRKSSKEVFTELLRKMKEISDDHLCTPKIKEILINESIPNSYYNMLLILSAYAARHIKDNELVEKCINRCNNNLYNELWNKWDSKHFKELK